MKIKSKTYKNLIFEFINVEIFDLISGKNAPFMSHKNALPFLV